MAPLTVPFDPSAREILVVRARISSAGEAAPADLVAAVDTGASSVVIPLNVARRLGYPTEGAPVERLVTGRGILYAPRVTLARVDVGGASATEVEAVCHDLPEECGVDALVGLSFLTRFAVRFDFDAWEMELAPRA